MTDFKRKQEEVRDSLDWGFFAFQHLRQTCQNIYEFLISLPDPKTLRMPLFVSSITRILRCYSYVFHWKEKTYKLFSPLGGTIKKAELNGNKAALKTTFWADKVIPVNSSPLSLSMVKGTPVTMPKLATVEVLIASKLSEALTYAPQQAWKTYNYKKLQQLGQQGLDLNLLEKCHTLLRPLNLPITSAHGDLHIENMILIEHEIKIIDWCMYNRKGSFITDYVHFYNFLESVKYNESWTISILRDQECFDLLARQLNTEVVLLKMIYVLNRIAGEVKQFTRRSLVPANQIAKYNTVLSHLIMATKQHV